jgi:hyperosmotically inducible protein
MRHKTLTLVGILVFSASLTAAPLQDAPGFDPLVSLNGEISDVILTTPRYGIFDGVYFEVKGDEVVLGGYVVAPVTKMEIERRVAKVSGIAAIKNEIRVLPLSALDDAIRKKVYNEVFSTADLFKYAMGAYPALHIIVKGGHVTLVGVVDTDMDKKLAFLAARGVSGVFSVKNRLTVNN